MEELKKRLVDFARSQYNMGHTRFEEYCGLGHGTISAIKSAGPSASVITRISSACPELNLNWLFTGSGEMLKVASPTPPPSSSHTLPLIPLEAFAGPGLPSYDDQKIEDFYTVTEFKESDFLIRVKGDSMTPKYSGGDLVACKKIPMDAAYFLQWGRVYVICTRSQGIMIKRVRPADDPAWITCVSDNPAYAPFDVPKEDIVSIALVNGAITLD